jgi:hypothetical protein
MVLIVDCSVHSYGSCLSIKQKVEKMFSYCSRVKITIPGYPAGYIYDILSRIIQLKKPAITSLFNKWVSKIV